MKCERDIELCKFLVYIWGFIKFLKNETIICLASVVFGSVIAVAFQSVFRSEIYQNNIFLKIKMI
jgi:hypothetical protein